MQLRVYLFRIAEKILSICQGDIENSVRILIDTVEFMAFAKLNDFEMKFHAERVWNSCKARLVPNLNLNDANVFLEWIADLFNLEDISSISLSAK